MENIFHILLLECRDVKSIFLLFFLPSWFFFMHDTYSWQLLSFQFGLLGCVVNCMLLSLNVISLRSPIWKKKSGECGWKLSALSSPPLPFAFWSLPYGTLLNTGKSCINTMLHSRHREMLSLSLSMIRTHTQEYTNLTETHIHPSSIFWENILKMWTSCCEIYDLW